MVGKFGLCCFDKTLYRSATLLGLLLLLMWIHFFCTHPLALPYLIPSCLLCNHGKYSPLLEAGHLTIVIRSAPQSQQLKSGKGGKLTPGQPSLLCACTFTKFCHPRKTKREKVLLSFFLHFLLSLPLQDSEYLPRENFLGCFKI